MDLRAAFARGAIVLLVGATVLKQSLGRPEWFTAYEFNVLFLLVGMAALAFFEWRSGDPSVPRLVVAALVTVVLVGVMLRQKGSGIPPARRELELLAIFLLFVAYPLLHHDVRRFLRRNGVYLLAYAALLGVYVYHGSGHGPGSGFASFPIASGFLLGASLFVVPRYVRGETFLWAVGRISAVVVLLGMGAYVFGEYTAIFVPVRLWETSFSPRLLSVEVNTLQAVFENPNATGIITFAGVVASVVELHRTYVDYRPRWDSEHAGAPWPLFVPAGLFVVNGVGLYLSHSRASMVAAGAGIGLYLAVAVFGRAVLPHALVAVVALVGGALAAVAANVLDVDSGGRFVLWSAGVEAILGTATLLGEGIVETGEIIAPHVTVDRHRGFGVHNSYLTTAIRAGLLGGVAHLVLAVGSVAHAALGDRRVDVAMIALALGFALHQLFESYTLFQHSMGAVLAAMAVGYVVTETREWTPTDTGPEGDEDSLEDRDRYALLE